MPLCAHQLDLEAVKMKFRNKRHDMGWVRSEELHEADGFGGEEANIIEFWIQKSLIAIEEIDYTHVCFLIR
jgi:hypothetical protein